MIVHAEAFALKAKARAEATLPVLWDGSEGIGRHSLKGEWGTCGACTMVRVGIGFVLFGYAVWIFP